MTFFRVVVINKRKVFAQSDDSVYASFIGTVFVKRLPRQVSLILLCKKRDNRQWRSHNVLHCKYYFIIYSLFCRYYLLNSSILIVM